VFCLCCQTKVAVCLYENYGYLGQAFIGAKSAINGLDAEEEMYSKAAYQSGLNPHELLPRDERCKFYTFRVFSSAIYFIHIRLFNFSHIYNAKTY